MNGALGCIVFLIIQQKKIHSIIKVAKLKQLLELKKNIYKTSQKSPQKTYLKTQKNPQNKTSHLQCDHALFS